MGCGISKSFIMHAGKAILQEYFDKNIVGQAMSSITASSHCQEPSDDAEQIKGFMKCQFMRGQREAWSYVLLFLGLHIIIMFILALKLWKVIKRAVKNTGKAINNLAIMAPATAVATANCGDSASVPVSGVSVQERLRRFEARRNQDLESAQ